MKFHLTLTESVLDLIDLARLDGSKDSRGYGNARVSEFLPDVSWPFLLDYTEKEIQERIHEINQVENVYIKDLIPGQNGLDKKKIYQVYKDIEDGQEMPPIIVISYYGKYYLWDGHHRAAAYNIMGEKVISARVLRL